MWRSLNKNGKLILVSSITLISIIIFSILRDNSQLVDKKKISEIIESNKLKKAFVDEPYIYIYTKDNMVYKIAKEAVDLDKLFDKTIVLYKESNEDSLNTILFIFIVLFTMYIMYNIRKSRIEQKSIIEEQKEVNDTKYNQLEQNITPQIPTINFSNVAGIDDVKEELEEIIDFLKNPQKYKDFDIRLPKGVLLIGPPGVGKTLIAKAVAGEADVPFFYQSAASFVHIYVGMGAKRVNELFSRAKQLAPSIIFIDEIDAVGKKRGGFSNDEREATLNQLLTEMDGFEESSGVIVIAATNKIEVLDDALLRAGRFDRRIHIQLPDFKERVSTLKLYLKGKKHSIDIERVAHLTIGFSTAALETLVNEAALYALKQNKKIIDDRDIEAVKDKVLLGKHRMKTFTKREKQIQALYQGAKAVIAIWLEVSFEKIGLLSSNFIPHHNEIVSKTALKNEIKVLLAGRVATQKEYNGELFTNAKEDINRAKILSRKIIDEFVMVDEFYSPNLNSEKILQESLEEVKSILEKLDTAVYKVRDYLLINETITEKETKKIIDEVF
jgi:ATP-dependent metalloprotease FtsH